MAQSRITIFGDLIDTADMPTVITNILAPGRLVGNDFVVAASDFMQITPGSCLLPNGILVVENETQSLVVPNSSLATDYTVIYQLEDTITLGGSPAILRLLSGAKQQADYTDGTILGWIRYPGGSVPLDAGFFVQPSHLRIIQKPDVFYYLNNCPLVLIQPPVSFSVPSSSIQIPPSVTANFFNFSVHPLSSGTAVQLTSAGLPSPLMPSTTYYIVNATTAGFQLAATPTGVPIVLTTVGSGTQMFTVQSQSWQIMADYPLSEACTRFVNAQTIPSTYTFRMPFTISNNGQPRKLVTRLLVDFNCLVTFSINLKGTNIPLSPNGGLISNTGTIITREFDIPVKSSLTWNGGATAFIECTVNSQPSRGVSIGYVGLTMEPTPFTLFT